MPRSVSALALVTAILAFTACGNGDEPGDGAVDASDEVNAAEMPDTFTTIETEGRIRSYQATGGLVWIDMTDGGPRHAFVFGWCPESGVTFEGESVQTDCF